MALKVKPAKTVQRDPLVAQMEQVLRPPVQVQAETPAPAKPTAAAPAPALKGSPEWIKRPPVKTKTTIVQCIVIDLQDHWNDQAMVDLKGADTSGFTWGYYGTWLPVLVEQVDHSLKPYYHTDYAGESSNRLFKAANPDGFRATFRHRSNLLTKLQVGLMVALVLGLFFIMFILINSRIR